MGISLKKNLRYFHERELFDELDDIRRWYQRASLIDELPVDSRIKSKQSVVLKHHRYFPDHQARKVFNDLLGFRSMCDTYEDVLCLSNRTHFRVADLSWGKVVDDGYRGVLYISNSLLVIDPSRSSTTRFMIAS